MKKSAPCNLSIYHSLAFILLGILISCTPSKESENSDHKSVQIDLNLPVMYSGTFPCADCPGVDYQIILEKNQFTEISNYQDQSPGTFKKIGLWKINSDTLSLYFKDDSTTKRFLIDEEHLTLLDQNNKEITGNLSDKYILERTEDLNSIRQHHINLAEQGFTYFASGNEPFWSLKMDSLNRAIFETADQNMEFQPAELPPASKHFQIDLQNSSSTLSVRINNHYCRDSMSGYLFPQTVTIILQTNRTDTLKGCGLNLNR